MRDSLTRKNYRGGRISEKLKEEHNAVFKNRAMEVKKQAGQDNKVVIEAETKEYKPRTNYRAVYGGSKSGKKIVGEQKATSDDKLAISFEIESSEESEPITAKKKRTTITTQESQLK